MKGKLFCLIGVSGVGKTEVRRFCINNLPSVQYLPSYTTRPPRTGEQNGVDYFFVSKGEFEILISQEGLIEWENHFDHFYGIAKESFFDRIDNGFFLIKEIAIGGYTQLLRNCPAEALYSIYLQPENLSDVVSRLNERGDRDLDERVNSFEEELMSRECCDATVISKHGQLESVCESVKAIIECLLKAA